MIQKGLTMAPHEDPSETNQTHADLLTNTTILELLRVAFRAGYAAAQHTTFQVGDAHLQAILEQFKNTIHQTDDTEDPASGSVRSGGEW
jgi:hypothetical protein